MREHAPIPRVFRGASANGPSQTAMKDQSSETLPPFLFALGLLLAGNPFFANVPGGGTGAGPNVTVVDNGNGTVTMGNGIVSIVITKADATIHQINYTYNNTGSPTTYQMLSGGNNGGMFYWEFGGFSSGAATFSVRGEHAGLRGGRLPVHLPRTAAFVDIHFSMLRGSTGFYVTPVWGHRSVDARD